MEAQICKDCKYRDGRCTCSTNSTCSKYEPIEMVKKKTWDEFRNNGLLWWANMILHTLGWAIVTEVEDGKVVNAYPARVKYRGFDNKTIAKVT